LPTSTGFKAIYTRLPAAAQEGAPLVNVAHNFETERAGVGIALFGGEFLMDFSGPWAEQKVELHS
jgi:hypothetical protein